jgi:hypothetical protein
MPRPLSLWLVGLPAGAACVLAAAQAPVFESQSKGGVPSFSDQPTPGAVVIQLPPPNVVQTDPAPASTVNAPPGPALSPYRSLVITAPANMGTIHSNTGAIDITASTTPALRAAAGDRIRVTLDGNLLAQGFRSNPIHLTSADWDATATDDVSHTLVLAVVDRNGQMLIESAPVQFYIHRATVHR